MSAIPQGAVPPAGKPANTGPVSESFFSVVFRRTRYVVAIALCACIFHALGWALVDPNQMPGYATASLLLGSPMGGLIAAAGLLILLLVCIVLSMVIVHPDVPHIGLYCACLGLGALSIRGGSLALDAAQAEVGKLWNQAQVPVDALGGQQASLFTRLIAESALWIVVLFLADAFCLTLFSRIFKNMKWLIRIGSSVDAPMILVNHSPTSPVVELTLAAVALVPDDGIVREKAVGGTGKAALKQIGYGALMILVGLGAALVSFGGVHVLRWGVILAGVIQLINGLGKALGDRFNPKLGALLVMILTSSPLLMILMQTELKGQVFFACFVSFGIAAFVANMIFPRAASWAFWVAVPITAIIGYAFARHYPMPYPGHVGVAMARGLPIDYISAGIPGAVLGYYTGLRWQIHQMIHEQ